MRTFYYHAIAFLLLGAALGGAIAYTTSHRGETDPANSMVGMDHGSMNMGSTSAKDMTFELKGKTGDDFDKAFLSMMIEHHEGAVDMAEEAKTNAKHAEIKAMADDIMSAQTREIQQMKDWQSQWGY